MRKLIYKSGPRVGFQYYQMSLSVTLFLCLEYVEDQVTLKYITTMPR